MKRKPMKLLSVSLAFAMALACMFAGMPLAAFATDSGDPPDEAVATQATPPPALPDQIPPPPTVASPADSDGDLGDTVDTETEDGGDTVEDEAETEAAEAPAVMLEVSRLGEGERALRSGGATLTGNSIYRSSSAQATVSFFSNTTGTASYKITNSSTPPDDVATSGTNGGDVTANTTTSLELSGLTAGKQYVHIVVVGADSQVSNTLTVEMPYDVYFYDDFEGYIIDSKPKNSNFSHVDNNAVVKADAGNKTLHLTGVRNSAQRIGRTLPGDLSGIITFEAKIKPISGTDPGYLRVYSTTYARDSYVSVVAHEDNWKLQIGANPIFTSPDISTPYTANSWYDVRVVYSTQLQALDVYIAGTKINNTPIKLSTPIVGFDLVSGNMSSSPQGMFDDIKVYVTDPDVLTGTPTIDNTNPKVGDILTASLADDNNTGTLSYTWKTGETTLGTGETYTVNPADFGNCITVEITSTIETGALTTTTAAVATGNGAAVSDVPTVNGTPTATGITVNAVTNAGSTGQTVEYAIATANDTAPPEWEWQDGTTFNGLNANTIYYVYARTKANDSYGAGESQVSVAIKTAKATQSAPAAPTATAANITANSITLTAIDGAEYRCGTDGAWQPSPTFSGLTPNTGYTFYARLADTATSEASPASEASAVITTLKLTQSAPAAPTATAANITANSITLTAIEGAEYRCGAGGAWQTSPIFSGLTPNTGYTFYARLAEDETHYMSPISEASAVITTLKLAQSAPAAPTPPPTTSSNSSSSNSPAVSEPPPAPTAPSWLEQKPADTIAASADSQNGNVAGTKAEGQYGVRGNSWERLEGHAYRHDTMLGKAVQVRLSVPKPELLTKDILVSGHVTGTDVDRARAIFEKWYANKSRVVHFDQAGVWGQTVRVAAKINLSGWDTSRLAFYAYDRETNRRRRISAPAYRVDAAGYIHFNTPYAGDIVISESELEKK